MAIYKLEKERLTALTTTSFCHEGIGEVKDLQKSIIHSIEVIDKDLFVLCNEFGDWEDSRRRIDILCLDKDANLVVVELKATEDGGHMELQAIRYAAMIADMTFDKAVRAYENYVRKNLIETTLSAKETILNFLEWDEVKEDQFANDVRIILVSADFSRELTTAVLWLLNRDIDIKCIRIKPQKDGDELYLDIQQLIPLPETTDYQVKLREKAVEQRQARRDKRDYSKFDININSLQRKRLNKRQAMIFVIKQCIENGIKPEELMKETPEGKWLWVEKICENGEEFAREYSKSGKRSYDPSRWFNDDQELIHTASRTYVFSNQCGPETLDIINAIFTTFPQLQGSIAVSDIL